MNIKKIEISEIWKNDLLERDKAGRWYRSDKSPAVVIKYIEENGYRTPSRAWPMSYFKPLLTLKFAKYVVNNDLKLAKQLNIID